MQYVLDYNKARNILTINSGVIEGYYAIWIQNHTNSDAPSCTVTLNGGIYKTTELAVLMGLKKYVMETQLFWTLD